eukprot:760149-Hanusia_phi.AAC.5
MTARTGMEVSHSAESYVPVPLGFAVAVHVISPEAATRSCPQAWAARRSSPCATTPSSPSQLSAVSDRQGEIHSAEPQGQARACDRGRRRERID